MSSIASVSRSLASQEVRYRHNLKAFSITPKTEREWLFFELLVSSSQRAPRSCTECLTRCRGELRPLCPNPARSWCEDVGGDAIQLATKRWPEEGGLSSGVAPGGRRHGAMVLAWLVDHAEALGGGFSSS